MSTCLVRNNLPHQHADRYLQQTLALLAEMAFLFTWFFQSIFFVDQRINYHPQMFSFFLWSIFLHVPANSEDIILFSICSCQLKPFSVLILKPMLWRTVCWNDLPMMHVLLDLMLPCCAEGRSWHGSTAEDIVAVIPCPTPLTRWVVWKLGEIVELPSRDTDGYLLVIVLYYPWICSSFHC